MIHIEAVEKVGGKKKKCTNEDKIGKREGCKKVFAETIFEATFAELAKLGRRESVGLADSQKMQRCNRIAPGRYTRLFEKSGARPASCSLVRAYILLKVITK